MKKKIAFNTSLIFMLAVALSLLSCKKDPSKCEIWEYKDICTPKSASANCYEYVNKVSNMCNAALQDAHEGRRTVIYENSNVKIERHYIREAN